MPEHEKILPAAGGEGGPSGERHTFDSVCGKCGALVPAGRAACLICRTPRNAVPYAGVFPVAEEEAPAPPLRWEKPPHARRSTEILNRWTAGAAGLILLLCLGLGGLQVYLRNFDTSSYRAAQSVVYEADGRLMLSNPGLAHPQEITGLTRPGEGFSGGELLRSPNGRWIAYTAPDHRLYLVDLARRGVGSAGELAGVEVAAGVSGSALFSTSSEHLLYLTQGGDLYASDFSQSLHLDTGVERMVAAEGKRVLYTRRGDKPGQVDLYLYYLPQDNGEWHVVDRDVKEILDWTPNFEKLLYTSTRQEEGGQPVVCLQQFDFSKSPPATTTLAKGVGRVLDASAREGTAVYLSPPGTPPGYGDFVDDDLAARDARLTQPDLGDFPLVEEAFLRYGEDVDIIRWAVNEELIEEFRAYTAAQTAWEEKQTRDELRGRLQSAISQREQELALCELYVYRGGALRLLDQNVWDDESLSAASGQVSAEENYATYQKIMPGDLGRVKMSAWWKTAQPDQLDPVGYYLSRVNRELRFSTLDGTPARAYPHAETTTYRQWRVAPGGSGVYLIATPPGRETGSLYYLPLKGGKPGEAVRVAPGVGEITGAFRDGVLFRAASDSGEGTGLYAASGETARPVGGAGAVVSQPVNGGQSLVYLDGLNPQTREGTLRLLAKEDLLVGADVTGAAYVSDETLYLFRLGEAKGESDIYLWQEGKETAVARGVAHLLGIPRLGSEPLPAPGETP